MSRVLIPSDNLDYVPWLADAYARRGFEVVTGVQNFFHSWAKFDIVHHVWGEELTNWKVPDEKELARVRESAERWAKTANVIFWVNNLYPHGDEVTKRFWKLNQILYETASLIVHLSKSAEQMALKEWPIGKEKPNLVGKELAYLELRPLQRPDRQQLRRELGFAPGDLVVLVFGGLRFWGEVQLIMEAFAGTKAPNKRMLVVARYNDRAEQGRLRRRYLEMRWRRWLKSNDCVAITEYVPDADISGYFEAADVAIVPRLHDNSSGVVGMALTFGTLLIVPNHGAFPDYIEGTGNLLYESGDAPSLAGAIDRAASIDRARISEENRRLADTLTWDNFVDACLKALGTMRP